VKPIRIPSQIENTMTVIRVETADLS